MKVIYFGLNCLFFLLLTSVYSAAIAAPGWTNSAPITELNQQPGNSLVFINTGVTQNPSGCSDVKSFYFAITDERHKRMFAMMLTAHISGRNVRIFTTGNCHVWGSAELDGFIID